MRANEISRQRRQPIVFTVRPPIFDRYVAALYVAGFAQTPSEWVDARMGWLCGVKIPDNRHRRLLRAYRERPGDSRAAEQRYELAPFHCPIESRMHLSFQFLAYAQALEVLHRRTRPNKQIFRKATFKKIRIALGKAIPDRYRGKSRLVDKFAFLNEITLADRLSELYRVESVLIKGLFPHEADLIAVKNIRNYLTHFSGTKTAKFERYMQTREFMILTRKMRILIEIFLLKEIGLGGAVRAIVSTNADYKWLCQEAHGIPE